MTVARSISVHGIVQGVGFRPFIFRLARSHCLNGWVCNGYGGVDVHLEGDEAHFEAFLRDLTREAPAAAKIGGIRVLECEATGLQEFSIRDSRRDGRPAVTISPDLAICEQCRAELFDPEDPRSGYPYINCTNCGPRYSVIESLPYDRSNTTMKGWALDAFCMAQFHNVRDRRFHAQPVACAACGPHYRLELPRATIQRDALSVERTAHLLRTGAIVAIKGLGGYHLACDARNARAVGSLRKRKDRKEKPFAVMARGLDVARIFVELSPEAERLLTSAARPIVLAPAKALLPEVAPDNDELGIMLPYTGLHHLLFAAGAPDVLVMTSGNRSSEPIAYEDSIARESLSGIADALLVGERPIARRVDDSVVRAGAFGPVILRRSRGYAPAAVTAIPASQPILALGADLKNSVTLVIDGQAFVSQHIGDLDQYESLKSYKETVRDLSSMYELDWEKLIVVHDKHPQYASTNYALALPAAQKIDVQHHRAHIASVLAEKRAWEKHVVGVSFDGAGFGDDGTIWGGEFFVGSLKDGFERMLHLRRAVLAGGDAAARYPVQCAAGFLAQIEGLPDLTAPPFQFPDRYLASLLLVQKGVQAFETTSAGRLFDVAAALIGFTRHISFEGQAAMWLEHLARRAQAGDSYPFLIRGDELDFRPLLEAVVTDRIRGCDPTKIARAFHLAVARGIGEAALMLCEIHQIDTVVLSGGVFQNELLLENLRSMPALRSIAMWTNSAVPPNDGGVSLGQAAIAAIGLEGPHA
jgi:hydrogenase maturation protein HypF